MDDDSDGVMAVVWAVPLVLAAVAWGVCEASLAALRRLTRKSPRP
jgi:hypothetical protein